MNFYKFLAACSILLLWNCSTTKKTRSTDTVVVDPPSINLDTIKVVANPEPKKEVYRASNPLINDILHTKLEVSFDWKKSQLTGKAFIKAKPYFYPTSVLYLDARGMEIKSVDMTTLVVEKPSKGTSKSAADNSYLQRTPLKYVYENDSLKIDLGREYKSNEEFNVAIEYISKPNELRKGGSNAINEDKGLYFINPTGEDPNKMPQIWTQGETQSNSAWFPCVDSPNEKMTNEIYLTVEDKYITLSNGVLADSKKNSDGTRTDHWKMELPHSAYLVMMAVGEFKKITDNPWNGKEISYYVEKEYEPHAKAIFGNTREMIDFYSKKMGVDFAWPKYSQIVVRDYVSGAMENTSATLHGDFMVYQTTRETIDGVKGEDVIAHELFHQWFGDLVTAESWSNLPLNESFATYGEYLWEEFKYGRDAADEHHNGSRSGYLAQAMQKQVNLVRFNYDDREDMFDAFSYNKGGQVLHMLRKAVGDDAFFASLKLYLESNKFGSGEIHNLRLAFEKITGQDMNWFFTPWFLQKGHPDLKITNTYNENDKTVTLTVKQRQDFEVTPLYKLPVYIDIYSGGKVQRKKVWIEDVNNNLTFTVSSKPDLVNFDAERQLLADIRYEKSKEEYIFQYKNAPLWGDRDEALDYFGDKAKDKDVYEVLKWAAQNDKWKNFRDRAIIALSEVAKENEKELKALFMSIAANDPSTNVRATAINVLASNFKGDDQNALFERSLNEQSYAIVAASLDAVAKTNPKLAMQKAKELETENSKKIIYTICDIYAAEGNDENHDYFIRIRKEFSGFELLGYGSVYGKYLKKCEKSETILKAADELSKMSKSDNQYVKYTALKIFKNSLIEHWAEKRDALQVKIEEAKKQNKDVSAMNTELKTTTETVDKLVAMYKTIK